MRKQDFYFAGHWLSEFGGRLAQSPQIEFAEYDSELIEIPGRSGDIYLDNKRFKNVPFARKITLVNRTRYPSIQQIEEFRDWIMNARGYQEFRDTQHPNCFAKAVLTNTSELLRDLPKLTDLTLNFNREPFWYTFTGYYAIELERDTQMFSVDLKNPEKYEAYPDFKIVASDAATVALNISINGVSNTYNVQFTNDYKTLVFNRELGQIFLLHNNQRNIQVIDGDLPGTLAPMYDNTVIISAYLSEFNHLSSATITPNWRHL